MVTGIGGLYGQECVHCEKVNLACIGDVLV